jgi:hypothetical protein
MPNSGSSSDGSSSRRKQKIPKVVFDDDELSSLESYTCGKERRKRRIELPPPPKKQWRVNWEEFVDSSQELELDESEIELEDEEDGEYVCPEVDEHEGESECKQSEVKGHIEEQTFLPDIEEPVEILPLLEGKIWKVIVERELLNLVKQQEEKMDEDDWEKAKAKIDAFWIGESQYTGSTILRSDPFRFWFALSSQEDQIVGNVASKLMCAAASEVVCERAFSHLRLVHSKEKKRLSLQNTADCVLLKVNDDIDLCTHF